MTTSALFMLETAELHAKRLRFAIEQLKNKIPVSRETIEHLSNEDVLVFELFSSRFSKLQDLIGNKLFTIVLEIAGEQAESMTFIDKLNKLEKLEFIPSAQEWKDMRDIRNKLSHEYPNHPELTADFFNKAYSYGQTLLKHLEVCTAFIKKNANR